MRKRNRRSSYPDAREPEGMEPGPGELETVYLSDAEIGRRLGIAEAEWPRVKREFEAEGMPAKDAITKKRFWPSIVWWLYKRHGLLDGGATLPVDGKENWLHPGSAPKR